MSLLEDIFLQDEAGEAQELERVIEGDEYDERPRALSSDDDNDSEKEDEAVEDKRRVDPTTAKQKRVIKNPRFVLNPARLTGPRGIQVIPEHFKDFKFNGKGHEKEDLDLVLKKLEHWAYRLYPKFQFEDCLKKIETLGKKRPVMVHLHKIRSNQFQSEETVVQKDSSDDELPPPQEEDEFDKLLQQQIDLARATPAPGSVRKGGFDTPTSVEKRSSLIMPKATASPSISDEQKERMMKNRQLAEERRLARLKKNTTNNIVPLVDLTDKSSETRVNSDKNDARSGRKLSKPNVINSSDDENDLHSANPSVNVDIHNDKNVVVDITEDGSVTCNLTEKNVNGIRNYDTNDAIIGGQLNKYNVIDSSDDENDLPSANRTINIDIQDDKNEVVDITREDNVTCNLTEKNVDGIKKYDTNNAIIGRKLNKSNVIDSSDDENDLPLGNRTINVDIHGDKNDVVNITEDDSVTCNLTEKNVNGIRNYDTNDAKIGGQLNKYNVIDSSEDENNLPSGNRTINIDIQNDKNEVVDITQEDNVTCNLTEKNVDGIKKYDTNNAIIGRKLNKSNVIDSSDDENDLPSANRTINVDIHGDKNDVVNITEDDSVTCNLTEKNVNGIRNYDTNDAIIDGKLNKSNVIDSSDDENDLQSANPTINVDIQNDKNDVIDITKEDNVTCNLIEKNVDVIKNYVVNNDAIKTNDVIDITRQEKGKKTSLANINSTEIRRRYTDDNQIIDIIEQVNNKISGHDKEVPIIDLVDKNTTAMAHYNSANKNQVIDITIEKSKKHKHTGVESKIPTVDLVGAANNVDMNINRQNTDDNNVFIDITRKGKQKSTGFNDTTDKNKTDDVRAKKSRRLSVLDSSDDESDLTVGNQSKYVNIIDSDSNNVNVHDLSSEDEFDKSASRNKDVSTTKQTSKTPNYNQIVDITTNEDSNVEEIQFDSIEEEKRFVDGKTNSKKISSINGKDTSEVHKDSKDMIMEMDVSNTIENENNEILNKDNNILTENELEDLMDVDFSDDF